MRYQGRITEWRDEKGFGFITPNGGGERIFLHIKSFKSHSRRPATGQLVNFERSTDDKGRPRAEKVELAASTKTPGPTRPGKLPATPVALAFLATLAGLAFFERLPIVVPLACTVMSLLAFVAYAIDKSAAREGRRRTPESTLQLLALAGGWPGALLAQRHLRHKSAKPSFQLAFWIIVAINVLAIGWLLTPAGASLTG